MKPPKGTIGTARLAAKGGGLALVLPDGKPPEAFRIFRAGVNESDYGPVTFDDIAAAMVMQNARDKGNPFYFDFNHGMTIEGATDEQAKAAGTFDLEVRDGELWASNCRYTENGSARLTAREYNLFSPYFRTLTDADGTCRPYELLNVAFVNLAGLDGLQPIAAGARLHDQGDPQMDYEALYKKAQARVEELEGEIKTLRPAGAEVMALGHAVGLPGTAGTTERAAVVTGLMALRGEVRKITGQDTDEKAVGALRVIAAKAERTDAAEARVGEIETKALRAELDGILDGASKDGKLPPADRQKLEETLLAMQGGKVTKQVIEGAKVAVSMMTARVSTGGGTSAASPTAAGGALPPELKANLGSVKPESVDKAFQRQQERRAVRGY